MQAGKRNLKKIDKTLQQYRSDEAILFCNMGRGSRLGHALALGIDPEKYYEYKGYKISLSRQVLLDDIVWMYCKASELGCHVEENLKTELHEKYKHVWVV